jgi:hypothetical protein
MTGIGWPLVELASKLLDRDEREAVEGDLLEANETTWQALLNALVLRRQALLWKQLSPWLAQPLLTGQGSAPSYLATRDQQIQTAIREQLKTVLPANAHGAIELPARAWAIRARTSF